MSLVDHAVWWQVYPLGALGAPVLEPEEGLHHRLDKLEPWLDYVVELGCSGVLLGPIFASTAHGYDTTDHERIDPRLGDDADFDALVAACRERGLALMLDGVFNHVGAQHPLVASDSPLLQHDGDALAVWEGHDGLVELDHANPAVADFVTDIMLRWLRRGIAGWRLDVAYAVPPAFWREVIGRVKAEFPDTVFLGEVIQAVRDDISMDHRGDFFNNDRGAAQFMTKYTPNSGIDSMACVGSPVNEPGPCNSGIGVVYVSSRSRHGDGGGTCRCDGQAWERGPHRLTRPRHQRG